MNVKPRYDVRNSPIPVPWPRAKPAVPRSASSRTVARSSGETTTSAISITVRRGDTVYAIARRSGQLPADIIRVNRLRAPYALSPGQRLALPAARTHKVRAGDTLYGISRQYGTDTRTLARMNGLRAPYGLRIGMDLKLPAAGARQVTANAVTSNPPPVSGRGFMWPVSGRILSSFGPKSGGLHNDGVNIESRSGTPVRAAEAGVVAYASDGIRGYGKLILIRHADGWVTAYAHNDDILVQRGDKVARGDVIGRVGATGGVTQPQLHFEIRRGTRAVDPLRYLPAAS